MISIVDLDAAVKHYRLNKAALDILDAGGRIHIVVRSSLDEGPDVVLNSAALTPFIRDRLALAVQDAKALFEKHSIQVEY